ncbi:membrane protein [Arthrobacter crystallopoietes BAB-32]|uniref:Membrane protein n=1 Tax=Arthrobacter crystallopoietes BAB-32 TaxID=1246476 RepID=N1UY63_9MICC|nr:DoxX family membrane protein [Arthrobacter crystallopoietes]EMY34005.1 membrane protein [Arthrobacter crystallopoietes BAB-32]
MTIVRLVARPLLATSYVAAGVERLRNTASTAQALQPCLDQAASAFPSAAPLAGKSKLLAQVVGATQIGAGLLLGLGKFSRLAAVLLAGATAVNAYVEYQSEADTAEGKRSRRNQLLKNGSLIGAALLAAVDTNGRPGLLWRAEHLAADARKSVKSISKDTRRNAAALNKDSRRQLGKAERALRGTVADVVGQRA